SRVVAPDAGVDRRALLFRRAGLADERVREDAVTAVEPAVRPPAKGVERLVRILVVPAVEQDFRLAGRLVLAFLDRHKEQIRCLPDPDAAEADFQAADEVQTFHEDGALVEMALSLGILEDDDAIRTLSLFALDGITVRLGDPQPAAVVHA